MLACLITTLLALPQGAAAAPAAAKAQIPEDLKKAATAVTDAKGYAFEIVIENSGGMFGGGRGRRGEGGGAGGGAQAGGGAPPAGGAPAGGAPGGAGAGAGPGGRGGGFGEPQTLTGKFEKGKPAAITREDQTVYKLNEQIVYSHDGTWELFQMPQFGGGGARGGGPGAVAGGPAGGGAPPAGGAGGGTGGPPPGGAPAGGAGGGAAGGPPGGGFGGGDRRRMGSLMTAQSITLPHEVLATLDTAVTEMKREEKDGKVVYTGPLSADLANKLSGVARMKEMMSRFGGSAGDLTASGTLTIVATKEGAVESMHIETKVTGGPAGESTRKVDVKLSGVGSTTVDVPKEALAKFSA